MRTKRGVQDPDDQLKPVFRDGEVLVTESAAEVRRRSRLDEGG